MSIITGHFYNVLDPKPHHLSAFLDREKYEPDPKDIKFPVCFRREIQLADTKETFVEYVRFTDHKTSTGYTISNDSGTIAEIHTPETHWPNFKDILFTFRIIEEEEFWSNFK